MAIMPAPVQMNCHPIGLVELLQESVRAREIDRHCIAGPRTDTPWMAFVQVVDAIDRLSQDPDESAETQLQEALKILPLVDPMSALRSVGPCEAIFTLVLTFSSPSRGFLKLPQLPHEPLVREDSLLVREDSLLFQRESSQASPESEEKQKAEPRKVSGVEMLQIRIPELPQLPSEIGSCTEEESAEGALAKRIFEPMTQSVSRTALAELLKATLLCVETCKLSTSMRPNEGDTPLQAEWRRQRAAVAHWAWQIHGEARELLRGLEDGWDTMSQAAVMKLRHLLYCAELRASREPQDIKATDDSSCPPEVWLAAESAAAATLPVPHGWQQPNFREEETFGCWLAHLARQLHETYAPTAVPLRLRAADVAQVEPLLLSLRLALAARRNLAVEQTCLVFLPDGRAETEGSEAQSPTPEAESVQFWDELDSERPPCFKPACVLPAALVSGMAPLAARNAPSEAKSPSPEAAPAAASPEPQTSPSLEGAAASRSTLTLSRSVRKIQIMASLNKGRRSSVKSGKKARESKEGRFIHKELGTEDLILTGLLADSNMAGVTRLPPMRAAATLRAGEYLMAACFPQATGCMNLFVHRLLGEEGVLPCSTELCGIRLPFWSKSWGRWQPVMLLDAPPCPALPGHLRGSEGLAKESLEELPLLARPFGLQPAALPALAGPPLLSRQTC
ncbi:unnamed protein product [Effrenium voratum]|nr:unnamed protein product [Effrenium voratum]